MKILIIRICSHISGAEIYNVNLIQGFNKYSNYKFSCISNSQDFISRLSNLGTDVLHIPSFNIEVGTNREIFRVLITLPIYLITYLKAIRTLERENRFDLICLQSMTDKLILTPILKLQGYKILWIEHGPVFSTTRSPIVKIIFRFISNFANRILAVSNNTKLDILNGGVLESRIKLIPIGINLEKFSPLTSKDIKRSRKLLNIIPSAYVICFVGSINNEKGIVEFIRLCEYLLLTNKDFHFIILGDGPQLNWAKSQARANNHKTNFHFLGFTQNVRLYLGISDMLLFPSKHPEGISLSLLEALSMRVLVLASDSGGNTEIIFNRKTGYIVDISDTELLAKSINEIIKATSMNKKIIYSARRLVLQEFNIKRQVRDFAILFNQI